MLAAAAFAALQPLNLSTAQSKSPVLKDPAAERSPFYLKRDRSTEMLFDAFMLVKKANGGDPVAEHELGLRYLQGEGFAPDTLKAAYWIGLAAAREYIPAVYNLGILKNNGWGTAWDPFGAFRNFRRAAAERMPEGMYMTGLFYTDNLVVRKDYQEAYRWIRAAADSGHAYAAEVLRDFEKTGIMARIRSDSGGAHKESAPRPEDTSRAAAGPPAGRAAPHWRPVFIEIGTDTLADPDDSTLAREAKEIVDEMTEIAGGRPDPAQAEGRGISGAEPPSFDRIETAAEAGSPEALTWLGRRYDRGEAGVPRDRIRAALYYLRAIRCESRWAPVLLWRLSTAQSLYGELALRTGRGDPEAAYVWACLVARGFDRKLTQEQALDHLRAAARGGMTDAIIELAMWYYAGLAVSADNARGDSLMESAARLGSREAEIRLAMSGLRRGNGANAGTAADTGAGPAPDTATGKRAGGAADTELIGRLAAWEKEGSVLAQVMLGYCYEGGRGVRTSVPEAVSYYRKAARRGSRIAYDLLKNLYNERRPSGPEWAVEDEG